MTELHLGVIRNY